MIKFEYPEDQIYFENLLLYNGFNSILDFESMFDFRLPAIKRKEFNKIRNERLKQLSSIYGLTCMLNLHCCDLNSGTAVDHLIPISTNKLNKELRQLKAEQGRKVITQSLGSNHIDNLVIACNNCNNFKKHKILERSKLIPILIEKKNK